MYFFFTGTAVLGITVTGADCSTVSGNRYQPDTDAGYSTCHSIRVCCPGMRMALYKSFKKESAASGSTDIGVTGIMPWIRDSFELLFFSRIIYGIALGLATTLNTAVVADFFHGKERVTAMGIQAASIGARDGFYYDSGRKSRSCGIPSGELVEFSWISGICGDYDLSSESAQRREDKWSNTVKQRSMDYFRLGFSGIFLSDYLFNEYCHASKRSIRRKQYSVRNFNRCFFRNTDCSGIYSRIYNKMDRKADIVSSNAEFFHRGMFPDPVPVQSANVVYRSFVLWFFAGNFYSNRDGECGKCSRYNILCNGFCSFYLCDESGTVSFSDHIKQGDRHITG